MIRSLYIAAKDLKAEFRTKQMLNSMFIFSLIVLVVFSVSFGDFLGDTEKVEKLAPGVLWIAFTFAGMLGLSRTFVMETENGCLEALMLCPVDRGAIYTGKILSNLAIVFLMEAVTLPSLSYFSITAWESEPCSCSCSSSSSGLSGLLLSGPCSLPLPLAPVPENFSCLYFSCPYSCLS